MEILPAHQKFPLEIPGSHLSMLHLHHRKTPQPWLPHIVDLPKSLKGIWQSAIRCQVCSYHGVTLEVIVTGVSPPSHT